MSYSESKLIRIQTDKVGWAFAWAFIDNVDESLKPDTYASYLRNWRLKWWALEIRPWFSELASTLASWVPISISNYIKAWSSDKLIIRHNQDSTHKLVLVDETWVLTSIDTASLITSDERMNFTSVWNVIYCFNWVDAYWKLDWVTYTKPAWWIIAKWSVIWWSTHWSFSTPNYPNRLYKSVAPSPLVPSPTNYEDWSWTWYQRMDFNEAITWLWTTNETLYVFTKNTISSIGINDITQDWAWLLFFNTRTVNVKEWAINHNSIVNVWVMTYFLTPNNKIQIISRWTNNNWYEIIDLSHRQYRGIDNLMATLDKDQTDSFAIYLQKEWLIKWHLKKDWSTINDIVIIYDIINDKFLIDEYKYFIWWTVLNNQSYCISAVENKVFKDEFWNDDDWSAIDFEYHTKEFDFLDTFRKKVLWETFLSWQLNYLCDITQEIWIDNQLIDTKIINWYNLYSQYLWIGTTEVWTEPIWEEWFEEESLIDFTIYRTKWNLNKKWKKIKYIYKSNSLWGRLILQDLQHRIELLSEAQSELT